MASHERKSGEASLALLDARSSHFGLESGRHGELSAEVSRNRGRGKSASPRSEVIGSDPESRRFGRLRKEFPCPEKRWWNGRRRRVAPRGAGFSRRSRRSRTSSRASLTCPTISAPERRSGNHGPRESRSHEVI